MDVSDGWLILVSVIDSGEYEVLCVWFMCVEFFVELLDGFSFDEVYLLCDVVVVFECFVIIGVVELD